MAGTRHALDDGFVSIPLERFDELAQIELERDGLRRALVSCSNALAVSEPLAHVVTADSCPLCAALQTARDVLAVIK